jgi:flavin reductase (DIM6/NTAB) family NADH-FMN oxidoreductase RutF
MLSLNNQQIHDLDKQYRISLINSLVGYRSLNLLGTANESNVSNLCIISSTFHLGANPPLLGLVMRPQREHNDTLNNIKVTSHYTLNNVLPSWYMQAHQTSASYPSGVSEFAACGFKEYFLPNFKAPFVTEATVRIGLELREVINMKINNTTIVIGEIQHILVDDTIVADDGTVDHVLAKTVTVAGLDNYYLATPLERLEYAKPNVPPMIKSSNQDL